MKFGFAIDRGGTFTDVYVRRDDGTSRVLKLLSEDPRNYSDAPTEAIRRVLEEELKTPLSRGKEIPTGNISWIRMGTTVATNALLERKGERIALVVTKGFSDVLFIGNQTRPKIFDLNIVLPEVLYERVVEVDERVAVHRSDCCLEENYANRRNVDATTGDKLELWKEPDMEKLERDLTAVRQLGIQSLAVVLLHSYRYPAHEEQVGKLAYKLGFTNVSLSSVVMPMVKVVPRGFTACADAYLTPKIKSYIDGFVSSFERRLAGVRVLFMQSDGGLAPVDAFCGSRAILSGPAGGVVGVSLSAYDGRQPVIGFDMGGTSTDVCRYAGSLHHVWETTVAGVTVQAPQLDVHTVAAGGGSRLRFADGLLKVGPESAGADPGPVCYRRRGGQLAVTDANLVLGRVLPAYFPHCFGSDENEPVDSLNLHQITWINLHSQPLQSITHVLVNGGENNRLTELFMEEANGSRLKALDNWMQPDTSGIRFFGTVTSDFTIDLVTDDSVALRMSFHSSSISRNSRINGIWGDEETEGAFALQLGQEIAVHIQATKDDGYQMKVNGTVFGNYRYRVDHSLVHSMEVKGLSDVYIVYSTDPQETTETIPCKPNGDEYAINTVK